MQDVTVCGRVKGTIRAVRVKLQNGGAVEGDIFHQSLSIDENSLFEGSSRHALCFVLRAVNRILSDEDQPNTTINRLWDVLDQPEPNRALRQNSRMILGQKKPPAR